MLIEPITTQDPKYERLVDALLKCVTLNNPEKRSKLISKIDDSTGNNVNFGSSNSSRETAISIVDAYYGFPHKIDTLLDAIKNIETETYQYKQLKNLIISIAENQQDQFYNNKIAKKNTLFDTWEFTPNDCNETFEELWSKLCLILDKIDCKDIWEACYKIEDFIKNDEIYYIKSLCFTKRYGLLKQIFLDRYDSSTIIKFGNLLKSYDIMIDSWLNEANKDLERDKANSANNRDEPGDSSTPILLVIVDQLANGNNQDSWQVRGQLKYQSEQVELKLSSEIVGDTCYQFEDIPRVIKKYIDFLEINRKFQNVSNLRVEIFLPLLKLNRNFDDWLANSTAIPTARLIVNYRFFIRTRERCKNSRIELLEKGWKKMEVFLLAGSEITKISIPEIIKKSNESLVSGSSDQLKPRYMEQLLELIRKMGVVKSRKPQEINNKSHVIEILEQDKDNISNYNWVELQNHLEKYHDIWAINWKSSLPDSIDEQMNLFNFIFSSGIPIAFWNWDSIPQGVKFETIFEKGVEFETIFERCLCRKHLENRCEQLLEETWTLRRTAWGIADAKRCKNYPGYYLSMLLEDPEILPEEKPLKTIGAK